MRTPPLLLILLLIPSSSSSPATITPVLPRFRRHHRLWLLDLSQAAQSPLFYNSTLNRRLPKEALDAISSHLVASGSAEWEDPRQPTRLRLWWRSPSEWAHLLHTWAQDRGLGGSVCTLYELREGDEVTGTPFYLMEPSMFHRVLKQLEGEGKVRIFTTENGVGVKFGGGF